MENLDFKYTRQDFYKVMASFRQQKFESGTWQNTDQTDIKRSDDQSGNRGAAGRTGKKGCSKESGEDGRYEPDVCLYSSSACGSRTCSICDCSK